MPGYATWQQLYQEEYFQMKEEGFDLTGLPAPENLLEQLPLPEKLQNTAPIAENEKEYERAYHHLWARHAKGVAPDFPYKEPEALTDILSQAAALPELGPTVSGKTYRQRIAGAFRGRCAAVVLGKPLEMGMDRESIEQYLRSVDAYPLKDFVPQRSEKLNLTLREDCIPSTRGNVHYVQPDDDVHYTLLALNLAETKGADFTAEDVGQNWLDNVPYHWFWCSSRQAYFHMVNLTDTEARSAQIARIPTTLNPWRECIDGQIRCDLWGYLEPGNPRRAAELAYRDCSFSLVKNGCYGGMFVAGCLAAALTENPSLERILAGGLGVIPSHSRLAEAIRQVIQWYGATHDWIAVCKQIELKYGHLPFAATINNLCMVTLALLEGGLDYSKTITTAVMCGMDTDCNAGTAGSIVGAAVGIDRIDARWIQPLNNTIRSGVACFGTCVISDIEERICALQSKGF